MLTSGISGVFAWSSAAMRRNVFVLTCAKTVRLEHMTIPATMKEQSFRRKAMFIVKISYGLLLFVVCFAEESKSGAILPART
jgi:hypothetical protein